MTNRLNNCEQANVDKIVATAQKQIEDIDTIINTIGFDLIDEKQANPINPGNKKMIIFTAFAEPRMKGSTAGAAP